ncbi:MAG: hypothetical protein M0P91_04515 [Sulfuricurvum sp.]|jgi:hypothetical protein|uniref:hypothetical protein n=1 Tax=Sulfuricurvum sp. TaxID=2025608 RepID=UPI0025E89984|nr:hypothetical protein [Sulfuricurvum sp.]MCK9372438.1 hypothetical protein [Sulfuricurvum sp.]
MENNIYSSARKGYIQTQQKKTEQHYSQVSNILKEKEILSDENLYNIQSYLNGLYGLNS